MDDHFSTIEDKFSAVNDSTNDAFGAPEDKKKKKSKKSKGLMVLLI